MKINKIYNLPYTITNVNNGGEKMGDYELEGGGLGSSYIFIIFLILILLLAGGSHGCFNK